VLTSPAYKRPPFFPEKTHTIPSTSPDILLSLLSLPIELAGAGRAPRAPRVPGEPDHLLPLCLSRVAESCSLHRLDILPAVGASLVSLLNHRLLPVSRSLCSIGLGKKPPDTDSVHKF
jgi:hypothetical protein